MRYACARCDWGPSELDQTAGPESQLLEHAVEAGHPLCRCCGRSLPEQDVAVCLPCVADTRCRLGQVLSSYALLPSVFGRLSSSSDWRRNGPRDEGTSLPGGDALVLRGPGSNGGAQLLTGRLDDGTPWLDLAEHADDELAGDSPSVLFELWSEERDWRECRGEPEPVGPVTLCATVEYLMTRLSWAADTHLSFPEFAHRVRVLLSRLETALATGERSDVGAGCQSCGSDLQRHYADAKRCGHERPTLVPQWLDHGPSEWLADCQEMPEELAARLDGWERRHEHCVQGGLEQSWVCPSSSCGRVYSPEDYRLAVAAEMYLKRNTAHYWVPIETAARLANRTQATIRRWLNDDESDLPVACDLRTRRLRVLLSSVLAVSAKKATRGRVA